MYSLLETMKYLGGIILMSQLAYAFTTFVLGNTMLEYFEWGYYKSPKTLVQKIINVFLNVFVGSGYYIYRALLKYTWIIRKLLFLLIYGGGIFIGMVIIQFVIHLFD